MNKSPDKEAFLQLIQENKGIVFKVCQSYCTNKYDREDLTQEIIYQLWRSYQTYDAEYRFTTWMYRVALNVAISFYRNEKKKNETVLLTEHFIEVIEDKESSAAEEERIKLLQQFIYGFKELDRALIILYLEDKSYREIGEIVGITESNVATKMSRLKDKLKQKFATAKL